MSKEEEKTLTFQNHHKQMKKKILHCERQDKEHSFTVKTEQHEVCGFSSTVVRSDGEVLGQKVYRGMTAVGTFLREILHEEENMRELSRKKADCDGARRLGKIQMRNRLPHL